MDCLLVGNWNGMTFIQTVLGTVLGSTHHQKSMASKKAHPAKNESRGRHRFSRLDRALDDDA